ncbi:hypothetical protein BXU06_14120 [Aquaspirillum sp. LM1]|uniref:phage tail protein n=1 Tax=Aquaspirillum sp. LM1 TaxID=1938604 RepID=UPI000983C00A|nr:tail fiber protein [Aquaspirillum sp. LM1]AQR66060.1 hypothetical protein BXU06_14120 [Aquaspirillum sp. LM1]
MDPILGQIILWPLNWVPDGWAACEGQELSIQQNAALYSLLGVTYGGNGSTTFKLPDLRSRVSLGAQIPSQVGTVSGATTSSMVATGTGTITLQPSQVPLPAHTHPASFTSTTGTSTSVSVAIPVDAVNGAESNAPSTSTVLGKVMSGTTAARAYTTNNASTTLKPFNASANLPTVTGTVAVGSTSASPQQSVPLAVAVPVAMSTAQPSLTLRYIIATVGTYPMRPS